MDLLIKAGKALLYLPCGNWHTLEACTYPRLGITAPYVGEAEYAILQ